MTRWLDRLTDWCERWHDRIVIWPDAGGRLFFGTFGALAMAVIITWAATRSVPYNCCSDPDWLCTMFWICICPCPW